MRMRFVDPRGTIGTVGYFRRLGRVNCGLTPPVGDFFIQCCICPAPAGLRFSFVGMCDLV